MRALIISSGNLSIEDVKNIRKSDDLIICADGGARHLYKTDIVPHMIVGDLDSLDRSLIRYYESLNVTFHKYSSEKDYTDTELAIDYALDRGSREIILLGATGTRLDHSLANIMLLYKLLKKGIRARIVDSNNEIYITDDSLELERKEDTYVSFLPIFNTCKGVSMEGFKYPTYNLDFELGSTMGISNELKSEKGRIEIKNGVALIIRSRD